MIAEAGTPEDPDRLLELESKEAAAPLIADYLEKDSLPARAPAEP